MKRSQLRSAASEYTCFSDDKYCVNRLFDTAHHTWLELLESSAELPTAEAEKDGCSAYADVEMSQTMESKNTTMLLQVYGIKLYTVSLCQVAANTVCMIPNGKWHP